MLFHITIAGQPFCEWTGCVAHQETADKAAVRYCTHRSRSSAEAAATRLRPFRASDDVEVHDGDCPTAWAEHAT
jgi:hypothetical protein